jgi:excisionase family DNA binding protein
MDDDRLLTTKELAAFLRCSQLTVRRLRAEGILRAYRIRRQIRFRLSEVLERLAIADTDVELRRRKGLFLPSDGRRIPKGKYLTGRIGKHDIVVEEPPAEIAENEENRTPSSVSAHPANGRRLPRTARPKAGRVRLG